MVLGNVIFDKNKRIPDNMNEGYKLMRNPMIWGSVFMLLGVVLGAFGAHALKAILTESQLLSFNTGVRYQMIHGLAMLILGLVSAQSKISLLWVSRLFIVGTLFFSVSIYLLVLGHAWGLNWVSFLGPVTPVGGSLLIAGWAVFVWKMIKIRD